MKLGEFLVARRIVSQEQVDRALERQREAGGQLGEHLVRMGALDERQLNDALAYFPQPPRALEDTGLSATFLLNHAIKLFHSLGLETTAELAEAIKLPATLAGQLVDTMRERGLIQVLGAAPGGGESGFGAKGGADVRSTTTAKGRHWAAEAIEQCQYTGPAPVPLAEWMEQVRKQSILAESINREVLQRNLSHMVLPPGFLDEIGPAVNSGRSMLIYGPPGNGKTTMAEGIGCAFASVVFIPYALEIDGQIIKLFDTTLHKRMQDDEADAPRALIRRRTETLDERWVPSRRPVIVVGGELTLDMLELSFNEASRFYEAPLHMKAINGVLLIDDFGRQRLDPKDLLNRWIVPMEKRVDYLTLRTGKTFQIPFDELLLFSTNLIPENLMDDAFLRRIPYKLEITHPSRQMYEEIFRLVCRAYGMALPDDLIQFVHDIYYARNGKPLAAHHPKFIVERVQDMCRYLGVAPELKREYVLYALRNLASNAEDARRLAAAA
jgi:MoxR-like ATPase